MFLFFSYALYYIIKCSLTFYKHYWNINVLDKHFINHYHKFIVKYFLSIFVCPKSRVLFYIVSMLWKLDKTSWTF